MSSESTSLAPVAPISPAQNEESPETFYIYHVHGVSIESIGRGSWPPSAGDNASSRSSTTDPFVVYSLKPPEEVWLFGLRGQDILNVKSAPDERVPTSPESLGITDTTPDGVCRYCQLMLHPDAPKLTEHHTSVKLLIDSCETCAICNTLAMSLFRGVRWLAEALSQSATSDKSLGRKSISIILTKYATYTTAIGCLGPRGLQTNHGLPLTITTPSRLGELATRRFWTGHHKSDHTKPHERIGMVKSWLSDCKSHEACNALLPRTSNSNLPTRVIDLTGSPDVPLDADDIIIRLREIEEGETGIYTALSHCWGSDTKSHFKTEVRTLAERKKHIDFASLPLTYREAILVTLYLGIRHLWIDSICIIQDSREDWEAESAKMSVVYTNAHLTLAATQSRTPQEGLLNPFETARSFSCAGEEIIVRMQSHLSVDGYSEPLNTRAWTLQEAVLSSRTVCFGKEQWLWKCPSRHATEDGLVDGPASSIDGVMQWVNLVRESASEDSKNYLRNWYLMVANYANRDLSHRSDKAAAIAGLVKMFVTATGYRYCAGVWIEDLANGLLWEASAHGISRDPGCVPSWSWLSVHGRIKGYTFQNSASLIEFLDAEEQWEGTPLVSPLKVARLTLKGPMFTVKLGKRSATQLSRHALLDVANGTEILGEAFLDSRLVDDSKDLMTFALLVRDEVNDNEFLALLIVPDAIESGTAAGNTFRRIGIAVVWKMSKIAQGMKISDGSQILAKTTQSTITLV